MPHCFVKQPNGKYAIWSTIVDSFLALDCTKEEAIAEEMTEPRSVGYPGGIDAYRKDLEIQFEHIEKSGIAWDWAKDWNGCVVLLQHYAQKNVLKEIDDLGLPRRMEIQITALERERYWRFYWRNKCELLEMQLRKFQDC